MIVAARIGVLLLVAVAAVWALRPGPPADSYRCPMHPEVEAAAPGRCPVCGMALETPRPIQAAELVARGKVPVHRRTLAATLEAPAWLDARGGVTALLFEDELPALGPARFSAVRAPAEPLAVERTADPPVRWQGAIWAVRFRFRPGGPPPRLRAGATGWLDWPARPSLVVLSSAVLRDARGPYLLSAGRRQPITTGRVASGYTVVVAGARERDLVVGIDAFSQDRPDGIAP